MKNLNEIKEAAEKARACNAQFIPFKKAVASGDILHAYQIALGSANWLVNVGVLDHEDIETLEGLAEGLAISYHANGQIRNRETYKNNKRHGLCEWWYKNGQIEFRRHYKNGRWHGLCELYDENGQIRQSYTYENDKLRGGIKVK